MRVYAPHPAYRWWTVRVIRERLMRGAGLKLGPLSVMTYYSVDERREWTVTMFCRLILIDTYIARLKRDGRIIHHH